MSSAQPRQNLDTSHMDALMRAAHKAHVPVNTAVRVLRGDWKNATDTTGRPIAPQLSRALEAQGIDPSHFEYLVSKYEIAEA